MSDPNQINLNSGDLQLKTAAQAALTQSRSFLSINTLVFVLGAGGAFALIVISFFPVCPPLNPSCSSYDKEMFNFLSLFPLGLGSFLFLLWINGLAQTIASRAALAAIVAQTQSK